MSNQQVNGEGQTSWGTPFSRYVQWSKEVLIGLD